jgi:hypothetical protein
MEKEFFASALSEARRNLEELLAKRSEIDTRISRLKNTIDALTAQLEAEDDLNSTAAVLRSVGLDFDNVTGITDAIRDVLRRSQTPLTAPQIRDALVARGFDVSRYSNPLTVIHNTINRMYKQQEVESKHNALGVFVGWTHRLNKIEMLETLMRMKLEPDDVPAIRSAIKRQKRRLEEIAGESNAKK